MILKIFPETDSLPYLFFVLICLNVNKSFGIVWKMYKDL